MSITLEAKIAKLIHKGITDAVIGAATHPVFCRLNLHNNDFLKKVNKRARIVYDMAYHRDETIQAPYNCGSDDNSENAFLAILDLIKSNHEHKEYIFERIQFLANEGLAALYKTDHENWIQRIHTAIHTASLVKQVTSKPEKTSVKKLKVDKRPIKVKEKPAKVIRKTVKPKVKVPKKRKRDKMGRFIKARR